MYLRLSRMATVLLTVVTGTGCGSESPGPGEEQVLTTLEVSPATAALYTIAPGNTASLTVVAKDQHGATMSGIGSPTFSSGNSSVADVAADGTITADGTGTTQITASLTAGGATETGTSTVSVMVAPSTGSVGAPQLAFQPQVVDVSAGGLVTWVVGAIHHDVVFTTAGAPLNIPELRNESAARVFPTQGSYTYKCSFHPSMAGTVRVH